MNKIITLTLNPSIDKNTSVKKMLPETKLHCKQPVYEPGGGGINVSRALNHLGCSSKAIYFAGGYTGQFFGQLLHNEGIISQEITIKGSTRENMIVVDESSGKQYRFGMEGPKVSEEEWKECLNQIEQLTGYDYLVASGSLPDGVPANFFGLVASIVNKHKARMVVDTSGDDLKDAVEEGVFMIKPNREELSSLYGVDSLKTEELLEAAQSIIAKKGCEVMVVSMGGEGAMFVSASENYTIQPPKVIVKSTVGAGDSMVAGMLYGLYHQLDWKKVLSYGIAAGSSATMNEGTELCNKHQTDQLFALLS